MVRCTRNDAAESLILSSHKDIRYSQYGPMFEHSRIDSGDLGATRNKLRVVLNKQNGTLGADQVRVYVPEIQEGAFNKLWVHLNGGEIDNEFGELFGIVTEVGSEVSHAKRGDCVAIEPHIYSDGMNDPGENYQVHQGNLVYPIGSGPMSLNLILDEVFTGISLADLAGSKTSSGILIMGAGAIGIVSALLLSEYHYSQILLVDSDYHQLNEAHSIVGCATALLGPCEGVSEIVNTIKSKGYAFSLVIETTGLSKFANAGIYSLETQGLLVRSFVEGECVDFPFQHCIERNIRIKTYN